MENCSEIGQELISPYNAVGCNVSLKLNFVHHHLDFLSWIHGSRVRWTWPLVPSGYFPNLQLVRWKRGSKHVGWLLLEFYDKGDINRQNHKNRPEFQQGAKFFSTNIVYQLSWNSSIIYQTERVFLRGHYGNMILTEIVYLPRSVPCFASGPLDVAPTSQICMSPCFCYS